MDLKTKRVLNTLCEYVDILNDIVEKLQVPPAICEAVNELKATLLELIRYYLNNTLISESEYCWVSNKLDLPE